MPPHGILFISLALVAIVWAFLVSAKVAPSASYVRTVSHKGVHGATFAVHRLSKLPPPTIAAHHVQGSTPFSGLSDPPNRSLHTFQSPHGGITSRLWQLVLFMLPAVGLVMMRLMSGNDKLPLEEEFSMVAVQDVPEAQPGKSLLEEIRQMRVKVIKQELVAAGIDTTGIFEKEDMVQLLVQHREQLLKSEAPNTADDVTSEATSPVAVLPMEKMFGTWHVPVVIQGTEWKFLVDTGASQTVLNSQRAMAMGLAAVPGGLLQLPITLGSRTMQVPLRVNPGYMPPECHGILGFDVLRLFSAMQMDFSQKCLKLYSSPLPPTTGSIDILFQQVSLGTLPFVTLVLANDDNSATCTFQALVDTGSPITIITPVAASAAGTVRGNPLQDATSVGVDGKPTPLQQVISAQVTIGDGAGQKRRQNVPLYSGQPGMLQLVGWQDKEVALLGMDLLGEEGVLTLDFSSRTLYYPM